MPIFVGYCEWISIYFWSMVCVEKGKEHAYGRDEELMRKDPGGTASGGQASMAVRTLAVQVSEELFGRFKAAVAKKGCRQKDFLIAIIEKAIEEIEDEIQEGKEIETAESEPEEMDGEQERAEPEVEEIA